MLGGLGKAIYGGIKNASGNRMGKNNDRPDYEIPDEVFENVGMFEEMAQGGLPQDELSRLHQNSLRGLTSSLSAGLQMGADASTVGDYYQRYLDANSDLGVKNSLQRFSNLNTLANARNALIEQKFIEFSYDRDQPYKDKAQAAAMQKKEGVEDIFSGADTMLGAYAYGEASRTYQEEIDANNRALSVNPSAATPPATTPESSGRAPIGIPAPNNSMVPSTSSIIPPNSPLSGKFAQPGATSILDMIRANPGAYGLKAPPTSSEEFYFTNLLQNGGVFFKAGERKK